jgi:hypothetical protein
MILRDSQQARQVLRSIQDTVLTSSSIDICPQLPVLFHFGLHLNRARSSQSPSFSHLNSTSISIALEPSISILICCSEPRYYSRIAAVPMGQRARREHESGAHQPESASRKRQSEAPAEVAQGNMSATDQDQSHDELTPDQTRQKSALQTSCLRQTQMVSAHSVARLRP